MGNAWMKHKLESRLPGEIAITSDTQMTPPLKVESEEELKSLLMRVKEESEKTKHSKNEDHGIWSHHFMGNRWENNGNSERLYSRAPKSLQMATAAMKLKDTCSLKKSYDQPR